MVYCSRCLAVAIAVAVSLSLVPLCFSSPRRSCRYSSSLPRSSSSPRSSSCFRNSSPRRRRRAGHRVRILLLFPSFLHKKILLPFYVYFFHPTSPGCQYFLLGTVFFAGPDREIPLSCRDWLSSPSAAHVFCMMDCFANDLISKQRFFSC